MSSPRSRTDRRSRLTAEPPPRRFRRTFATLAQPTGHPATAGQNDLMPPQAAVYSAPDSAHVGWLTFTDPVTDWTVWGCTVNLALDGEEWSVVLNPMIPPYTFDMVGFFEEIARDRAGWAGAREWESEDSEARITATHEGDR